MLWLVVPTFAKMFKDMGAELPGMTQFVVDASDFIVALRHIRRGRRSSPWCRLTPILKTEQGRPQFGGVGLVVPMVGELIVQMAMYRFASNIALAAQERHADAGDDAAPGRRVPHQPDLPRALLGPRANRVAAGRPLAVSLEETGLFTAMMTNMVRIGEESGQLQRSWSRSPRFTRKRWKDLIAKVTKLLEPVIIMGMGVTIAGLMLSIYMPMFEMAGKVH